MSGSCLEYLKIRPFADPLNLTNASVPQRAEPSSAHERRQRTVLATKPYAVDHAIRSWWSIFFNRFPAYSCPGWNSLAFPLAGKIICTFLPGFCF